MCAIISQKPSTFKRVSLDSKPKKGLWKKDWKSLLKLAGLALGGLTIVGFFAFAALAAWVSRSLPDPNTLSTREVAQATKIYDRTGQVLLYEIHGDENRTLLKIEDIPKNIKDATVAIEDKGFYTHHGVYWQGLIRAAVMSVLKLQKIQGTSTLTQQLVKNAMLTNERTLTRKLKEFILSLQIERTYSKDQILQMYLNEIPYGSNIYGIESAAQSYFKKPAKELTLDEAALLAAIPQAPDFYSPYGTGSRGDNRSSLVGRQHYILNQMADQGYITQDQATEAKAVDTLKKIQPRSLGDIKAPHFVMYVKSLLSDTYGVKQVEQGGLKVTTTLDWEREQIAEDEVKKGVEARGAANKFSNAALVSLDPKTGQVLAMVGSKDFFDNSIDGQVNVTLQARQPGSSFKPIVYAAGFMLGYTPDTQLWDVNTTFKTDMQDYTPHDYDGKERGIVSVRQALQGSLNIPAVKMLYLAGIGRVLDFAQTLGYTTLGDRSRFGLSLVLGGGEVKPIEHAAAFAAFANDGQAMPTSAILKVEDTNGQVLEEWKQPVGERVVDPQIARLVSNVLSDNNARTYIFGAKNSLTLSDRPVAAKTGTTNNYHDAWTVGYTPNLVAVVWVGNNDNSEMKKGSDGSIIAAPIWQGYMKRAVKGLPVENFVAPAPPSTDKPALLGQALKQTVKVNSVNGKLATAQTPPDLAQDHDYIQPHSILFFVDKDDPLGPVPTNPATDPQFGNWESAIQLFVSKQTWSATTTVGVPPTELDDGLGQNEVPLVTIISPQANSILETRQVNVQVDVKANHPIMRVEAYMDDNLLGATTNPPYNFWVNIPANAANGPHTFTVKAFDDANNAGNSIINLNLVTSTAPGI